MAQGWTITGGAGDATIDSSGVATFPKNTGTSGIKYTVKYEDANGCTASTEFTIPACGVCNPNPTFSNIKCNTEKKQECTITTTNPCTTAVINYTLTDSAGNIASGGVNITQIGNYTFTASTQMVAGNVTVKWWNTADTSVSGTSTITSPGECDTCELYFCNSQGQQTSVSDVTVTSIGLTSTTTHYVDWENLESNLHYDYVYSTQEPTVDFYIPVSEYIINIPDGYGAIVESVGNNIYKITYWVNINPENNFDEYIDAPAVENQQTVTARITGCNNKTVTRKITKNSGIAAIVEGDNAKIRDSIAFNRIVTDSSFYFTFSGPSSNVSFYSPYEIHLGTFGTMDENCRSNIYADTYVYTTTARTSSECNVHYVLDDEEVRWEISTDQNYNSQQIIEIYPGIDKERHEFMANTIGSTTLCRQFWVVVGCSDEFSIKYKGL